ncbi:17694_t:CDS:1 [Funneliformis geosporum]|uniref:4053_t:CDS:1 n=1 Tax=Funneliformis geosporum TaxID=1117311 RepID=A0A9W4X018_9GLOM|nr:17694_t:CDS:1 [Funneliformis geosporum]CAI2176374.1 4053_t:CDS:1 [Funneliformis geosporum]
MLEITIEKFNETYPLIRSKSPPYKRVILLALDGLGTFYKKVPTPNLDSFVFLGPEVRAQLPSYSAENWGSILHGVIPSKHGLTNDTVGLKSYDEKSPYPSLFKLLQQDHNEMRLASFVSWGPINTGIIELSVKMDKYSPEINENFFLRFWLWIKLRILLNSSFDPYVVSKVTNYILDPQNNDVEFLFIHLVDVDEHGHAHRWGSKNYLNQMIVMDSQIGEILKAIETAGWSEDSLIIAITDHGGVNHDHGGKSDDETRVFMGLKCNGFNKEKILEEKITNMDCAAIILNALGFEIPSWFDAKLPSGLFNV